MKRIFPVALLLLGAGCAQTTEIEGRNYMTYDHAFTDRAAEDVRQRAEKFCAQKKQVAVKTARACSLERCTTNFACVDRGDAKP
jgi:hypothetical protein